jgi:hypothetical protein
MTDVGKVECAGRVTHAVDVGVLCFERVFFDRPAR